MSVFGDAEFVKKVKEEFICVAVNQHHHRRRTDLEYNLFEKLVEQTGEKVSGYNQGLYFFSPSAELLSFSNTVSGEHAWKLLRQAQKDFEPPKAQPAVLKGHEDAGPLWKLPDGSQLVLVNSKVLGGYEKSDNSRRQIHQQSLGVCPSMGQNGPGSHCLDWLERAVTRWRGFLGRKRATAS